METEVFKVKKDPFESLKSLGWTFVITLGFFLVFTVRHDPSNWIVILKISLGYGLSIFGLIWLAYALIETLIDIKEAKTGNPIAFGFWGEFATSMSGLIPGAFLGEYIKSLVLNRAVDYSNTPFIILIGIFISLMFIFHGKNKSRELENKELAAINENLKIRKDSRYLKNVTAKIGNQTRIIEVSEIDYIFSQDHYTTAYTQDGEYIIDLSIKKLSESLDPSHFIQLHRNSIVRLNTIDSIENGNNWVVKTRDGKELNVSRNNRKKLKEALL